MSLNAIRFKTIFVLDAQVQLKTFLIHAGLPTGDIVTNIMAMACESDEYDAIFGMDIISLGDFAITNQNGQTTFSFRIPSSQTIEFK